MRLGLWTLFLLRASPILCQNLNYIHYNTNNSRLPHNITYGIRQDRMGFIWICTDDGLVKFDGTKMVNLDKGLLSKYTIDTDEENGCTWVATWKGGVHKYKNDSAVLVPSLPSQALSYSANRILVFNNLVILHNFQAYIVFKYDSISNTLKLFSLKQNPDTLYYMVPGNPEHYQFIKTKNHHLYAYNKRGLFEAVNDRLVECKLDRLYESFWESPDGKLYGLTDSLIYEVTLATGQSKKIYTLPTHLFKTDLLKDFCVLPSGNVCISGYRSDSKNINAAKTHYLINNANGAIIDLSTLAGNDILLCEVLVDQEGSLWLTTDGQGVFHIFDPRYQVAGEDDKTFENSTITDLLAAGKDSLLIGTKEGLYLFNKNRYSLIYKEPRFRNYYVKKLFFDQFNRPGANFATLIGRPFQFPFSLHGTRFLSHDSLDSYYSTAHYAYKLDLRFRPHLTDKSGKTVYPLNGELNMHAMVEEANGSLWLLGAQTLLWFHPKTGYRNYYNSLPGQPYVNCGLWENGKGLWIGTNHGIFLRKPNGEIWQPGTENGLTNTNVKCLTLDKYGRLWIGTQNGLFCYNGKKFNIYKKRDGLISDDVSCFAFTSDNTLVLGSSNGLTFFKLPVTEDTSVPPLLLETVLVNNRVVSNNTQVYVPFNGFVHLEFSSITFKYPELTTFEYRLKNSDEWITTNNRTVLLSNLQPGRYAFEIRAKNYKSNYSPPIRISIEVELPWWKSFYVVLLAVVLVSGALFLLFYRRVQKQKAELQARQELAGLKLKALQAQLNPHFVSNALNAIQLFILKKDEVSANNYLSQFTALTRLFLEVSRSRLISLSSELELLGNYVSLEKLRFGDKFDFSLHVDPAIHPASTLVPGLIIQPFVENSINHGLVYLPKDVKGLVSVHIALRNAVIHITIDDNGIGREKSAEVKQRQGKPFRSHSGNIMQELEQAYNNLDGCELAFKTVDKKTTDGQPGGTCVYISLKITQPNTEIHHDKIRYN